MGTQKVYYVIYESFVNVSKWMGTNCEIVGEKRELLVLELAVGKYIE